MNSARCFCHPSHHGRGNKGLGLVDPDKELIYFLIRYKAVDNKRLCVCEMNRLVTVYSRSFAHKG